MKEFEPKMGTWEDFDDYEDVNLSDQQDENADSRDFGREYSYEEELFEAISQDDEEQYAVYEEEEDEEFLKMGKKNSRLED